MPDHEQVKLTYLPSFDGLRAVAATVVFLTHYVGDILPGGSLGVDVFFVLSGFLITSLLLEEYNATASLNLGYFFARRALRLYPALVFLLLVVSIGAVPHMHDTGWGIFFGATYTANWAYALASQLPDELAHLWSLAAEEQFYLVWPILLLGLLRRNWTVKRIASALVIGLGAAILWRTCLYFAGAPAARLYCGFDTHADGLIIGCLLGVCFVGGLAPQFFRARPATALLASLSATALGLLLFVSRNGPTPTLLTPVYAVCGAAVFCGIYAYRNRFIGRVLALPCLLWLGRRSYAFYLWHQPIKYILYDRLPDVRMRYLLVIGFSLTLAAAEVSWRLVEAPVLKLKARFEAPGVNPTRSRPELRLSATAR